MRIRPAVAALLIGAAVMATPGVATAAYPGANGRIAFEQGGSIYICSDSSWCDAALARGMRAEGRGPSSEEAGA